MANILLIGPPGAGKGTQAASISRQMGIVAVSTGEIFRKNVSDRTPLGLEAQRYISAGELVPDAVTNNMILQRLSQPDTAPGFLLDGYPRNVGQIAFLDTILAQRGEELAVVLQLVADEDELLDRLHRRASLEGRKDDTPDAIRHRLRVYQEQTEPVVSQYRQRGDLVVVDGIGTVDEVGAQISAALESLVAAAL